MYYRQSLCKLLLRVHKCELTAYDTYCACHFFYISDEMFTVNTKQWDVHANFFGTTVFRSVDTIDLIVKKKIETEMMRAYVSLKHRK